VALSPMSSKRCGGETRTEPERAVAGGAVAGGASKITGVEIGSRSHQRPYRHSASHSLNV
jgi:hypothetical protein